MVDLHQPGLLRPLNAKSVRPMLGHGVGLRVAHFDRALDGGLDVDLVEAISENFFGGAGRPMAVLERLRQTMPVVLHGVSMALGSTASLHPGHLRKLRDLCDRIEPAWVGDHLCWGHVAGHHVHDLLPLPFREDVLNHVVERIARAQDALGRRLVLENVSAYVGYATNTMDEWEFVAELLTRADAWMLLDVNNVVVNARNFGFDPRTYVERIPSDRIVQLHLANHTDRGTYKFDSHRGPVPDEVWQLYEHVLAIHGPVTTIIEWDEDVPPWETLCDQQRMAAKIQADALAQARVHNSHERLPTAALPLRRAALAPADSRPVITVSTASAQLQTEQAEFWSAITWPTGIRDYLAQAAPDKRDRLLQSLHDTPEFDRVQRLQIYAEAYFWRLHGVLRDHFGLVAWLLGPARFHNLVTDYVLACPSIDPDIRRYGVRLPAYIAAEYADEHAQSLAQIAAVEWAMVEALDIPQTAASTTEELSAIAPEQWPRLHCHTVQSAQLLRCDVDFSALWARHFTEPSPDTTLPARDRQPRWILVWRQGLDVYHRNVGPDELAPLQALRAGNRFENIAAAGDLEAHFVAGLLRRWVDDQLLYATD